MSEDNILGPYDQADFKTMSTLKQRIKWFLQDRVKYSRSIEKDKRILNLFIRGKVA